METATNATPPANNTPAPASRVLADCCNCGVASANVVTDANRLFEPGLYCSLCDAGPLPPAAV